MLLALNDVIDEEAQVQPLQRRIASSDDPAEILALAARLRRQLMESAGDIVDVLTSAAHADEDVAEVYREGQERSRIGCRRIVERLDSLGALREELPVTHAADALYALLHHAVWTRLVSECGWTADAFETWCSDILCRALLRTGNASDVPPDRR